ncbi:GntR family transcriptional regulator [Pseudaquabacterium rugosum]|jgi:DNA-binding GntR family transcriptional regulator|uniref:GntR family transcriptional regulator n=1 Tax=Pseudaquabacterium rugosum TaxID=2984194 RepID=A0ABU9BCZ0_9BURK
MDRDPIDTPLTELPVGADRKTALLESLRRRILCLHLKPGTLLDETELGREFGLSRSPVRELLRQMAAEGYVELEANRAPRVAALNHEALRNFYLAAPVVYVATTRLAALHATAEDIAGLKRIQVDFCRSVANGDIDERVFNNDRFHDAIGRMGRNPYWLPTLHRLQIDHARLAKTFYQPHDQRMVEELAEAIRQHDEMIEAIERHDADRAAALVRAHLDLSRQNLAMYVAPPPDDALLDVAPERQGLNPPGRGQQAA